MPTTSTTPYLTATEPNVHFVSLLTAGDSIPGATNPDGTPWRFVGVPDGLGAFDNGDGTVTVLVNHEIGGTAGAVRDHGSPGAFVSRLTIDKQTLDVVEATDLAKGVLQDNDGDGSYTFATTAWNRFCSGDLADPSAFYDEATGLGTQARIYLTGEEAGSEGRAFGFVVTGSDAGRAYELPTLGNMSFENVVASPNGGAKTIVVATDDSTPGQVYVYVGDKQATGTEVDKAGLTNGVLYGIMAEGIGNGDGSEAALGGAVPLSGSFSLVAIDDAKTSTGAQIETFSDSNGVSEFWRPEDSSWDTQDPNRLYFVTTADNGEPSRLWALDFVDINDPTLGGTFTALLDGTEGHEMLDNMTVADDGKVILQEDPGGDPRLAKVWVYDPATDSLNELAEHDPARFGPPVAPFTQNEESSGVIDVTALFGDEDTQVFLLDTQAHYSFGEGEIVEGGQLALMYVEAPQTIGTRGDDSIYGSYVDDDLRGFAGNDTILGGGGEDTLGGYLGDDSIDGGLGDDEVEGHAGNDTLAGGDGMDTLSGNVGDDLVDGGEGNDSLAGQFGDDTLIGGAGDDALHAGAGRDVLVGGLGSDALRGGGGADAFRFGSAAEGGDVVQDFHRTIDVIEVSASGFGGGLVAGAGLTAAQFVASDSVTAVGGSGQFIWEADERTLWWDADGTGAEAAVAIAQFEGLGTRFQASDIAVIA